MASLVWKFSRSPSTTYPSGRICSYPPCKTILSIYNSTRFCSLHSGYDRSFNVHTYIDRITISSSAIYLLPDEVHVLEILSNPLEAWHLLNDRIDYLGGRHKANNVIRRLRRKGYHIESKRSGGYRLLDRIPSLTKGGSCEHAQTS